MKTILVLAVFAVMACGGTTTPAPQAACASTCSLDRPWILTVDGTNSTATGILHLENGSPAHWIAQEANGLSCTYDVTLSGTDTTAGSGTFAVQSADSEPTVGSNVCGTMPATFSWVLDQCNCVLSVTGSSFAASYY